MEKIIHDAVTNEVQILPMIKAEIDDHKLHQADTQVIDSAQNLKQEKRAALLIRLSITPEEAELLLS